MKKFAFIFALIICVASVSFAAPVSKAPASKAPAAEAVSSSMGMTAISLNSLVGFPSLRFGMGSWSLEVGGTIASPAAGTTNVTVGGRADIPLNTISDELRTYMAPTLVLTSAAGTSVITASFLLGAEYMFAPHLAIFADLTAFTLTSAAGTTTWGVGTNSALIYTGGRLYF
ncbi:MAG: hypothetical protein WC632_00160 [Candidatus Margulisiibacteriota bacterium]